MAALLDLTTGGTAWNAVANKLNDPTALGDPISPAELQAWLAGSTVTLPASAAASTYPVQYAVARVGPAASSGPPWLEIGIGAALLVGLLALKG